MNDEDKKLLELYLKESKKKRIIIVILILSVLLFGSIIARKYYIEKISDNEDLNNSVELEENSQNFINELVENNGINNNLEICCEEINQNIIDKKSKEQVQNKTEEKDSKTNKTNTSKHTKKKKPLDKDFLFIDGYNMENVTKAAQEYLKSSGYAGECIPLKDSEGVYIGMKVHFY